MSSSSQIASQQKSQSADKIKQVSQPTDLVFENEAFALPYTLGKRIGRISPNTALTSLANEETRDFNLDPDLFFGDISFSGTIAAPSSGTLPDATGFMVIKRFAYYVGGREYYTADYLPTIKALLYQVETHERSTMAGLAGGNPGATSAVNFSVPVPLFNHSLWHGGQHKYIPAFAHNGTPTVRLTFRAGDAFDGDATYGDVVSNMQMNVEYIEVPADVRDRMFANRQSWKLKCVVPQTSEGETTTDNSETAIDLSWLVGDLKYIVSSSYDSSDAPTAGNDATPFVQLDPDIIRLRINGQDYYEATTSTEALNDTVLMFNGIHSGEEVIIAGAQLGDFSNHPYGVSFSVYDNQHGHWLGSYDVSEVNQIQLRLDVDATNTPTHDICAVTNAIAFIDERGEFRLQY